MHARHLTAAALAGALLLSACNGATDTPAATETTPPATDTEAPPTTAPPAAAPATLAVTATDDGAGGGYAFDVASEVPAGPTRIDLSNTGAEPHHAQLIKLNADATMDDLGAALATGDPAALFGVASLAGGTGTVAPGGAAAAAAVVDLSEGTYVFLCFVENEQGPHIAQGMVQPFTVTPATGTATPPTADAEIGLIDYGFEAPDQLDAGATFTITNRSQAEPHEMNMLRLADDATVEDVLAMLSSEGPPAGPPPFFPVGGMQALAPGDSQILTLDVDPGRYVLICFIPSVLPENQGQSHAQLGMLAEVEIS